jgi:hypothetical protein
MSGSGRARLAAGLIFACAALTPAPALAHDDLLFSDGGKLPGFDERHLHQHGGDEGHLPATRANVDVVSKLALKNVVPEKIADVGVSPDGNTAFLAAWGVETCKYNGVHVVDISNPAAPRETGFIPSKEGSYPGEGMHAISQTTSAFNGTVLVTNNEKCKGIAGFGGLNLYDVTNPKNPTPLAVGIGDFTTNGQGKKDAHEIHSVFAWDAGARAYAAIVDNEEGADLDIMDITDPRAPFLTAEYDLDVKFPQIRQDSKIPNLVEIFLHDMVVKEVGGRQIMSASYWDAGHVQLDVTNPKDIKYLGDTDMAALDAEAAESGFRVPPEGNAHQSEFTADNAHLIGSDEDFTPYATQARNTTDATDLLVSQGSDTKPLVSGTITGQSKFVGRACPGDAPVPAGDGRQIAVVERGVCDFTVKVAAVEAAGGYVAAVIFNREGSDACNQTLGMTVEGGIPTFGVAPRQQGLAIFGKEGTYNDAACLAGSGALAPIAVGATGDTLEFQAKFDGWGYVRLFKNGTGKLRELDTYAIPEAHDPARATDSGDLSVHEVATSPTQSSLAYYSYYTGGFRVTRIQNGQLVEKGRFIAEGGSNLWGVDVFSDGGTEYVAASDRDEGLYIFRYTGG